MNIFDEVTRRIDSNSTKWNSERSNYLSGDIIPMWIADMDFKAPPNVIKALQEKIDSQMYTNQLSDYAVKKTYPLG
ncbi:hypothetical protein HB852_07205 [Listeria grandensis]|uniref:hypothetical protein n=1 Tax=Listeria grandensis TaxID=1494963 RepID=UPI00162891CB|nr:hypothetical protein [Listeria grandensis]MBC1474402.1 hypothetical protein [Listeria grandensis]